MITALHEVVSRASLSSDSDRDDLERLLWNIELLPSYHNLWPTILATGGVDVVGVVDVLKRMNFPASRWVGFVRAAVNNGAECLARELTLRYCTQRPDNLSFLHRVLDELDREGVQLGPIRGVVRAFFGGACSATDDAHRHGSDTRALRVSSSSIADIGIATAKTPSNIAGHGEDVDTNMSSNISGSTTFRSATITTTNPSPDDSLSVCPVSIPSRWDDAGSSSHALLRTFLSGLFNPMGSPSCRCTWSALTALFELFPTVFRSMRAWIFNKMTRCMSRRDICDGRLQFLLENNLLQAQDLSLDYIRIVFDHAFYGLSYYEDCFNLEIDVGEGEASSQIVVRDVLVKSLEENFAQSSSFGFDQPGVSTERREAAAAAAARLDDVKAAETTSTTHSLANVRPFTGNVNGCLLDRSGMGTPEEAAQRRRKTAARRLEAGMKRVQWLYAHLKAHYIANVCGPLTHEAKESKKSKPAAAGEENVFCSKCRVTTPTCLEWLVAEYCIDPRFVSARGLLLPNIIHADRADLLHTVLQSMVPCDTPSALLPDGTAFYPVSTSYAQEKRCEILEPLLYDCILAPHQRSQTSCFSNVYGYALNVLRMRPLQVSPLYLTSMFKDMEQIRRALLDYANIRMGSCECPTERKVWKRFIVDTGARVHTDQLSRTPSLWKRIRAVSRNRRSSSSTSISATTTSTAIRARPTAIAAAAAVAASAESPSRPCRLTSLPYLTEDDKAALKMNGSVLLSALQLQLLRLHDFKDEDFLKECIVEVTDEDGLDEHWADAAAYLQGLSLTDALCASSRSFAVAMNLVIFRCIDFDRKASTLATKELRGLRPTHLPVLREWMLHSISVLEDLHGLKESDERDNMQEIGCKRAEGNHTMQALSAILATMHVAAQYPAHSVMVEALDMFYDLMRRTDMETLTAFSERVLHIILSTRAPLLLRRLFQEIPDPSIMSPTTMLRFMVADFSSTYKDFLHDYFVSGNEEQEDIVANELLYGTMENYFQVRTSSQHRPYLHEPIWNATQLAYVNSEANGPALWCISAFVDDNNNAPHLLRIIDLLCTVIETEIFDESTLKNLEWALDDFDADAHDCVVGKTIGQVRPVPVYKTSRAHQ